MGTNQHQDYLKDLVVLLQENAEKTKKDWSRDRSEFNSGLLMAYHTVFSLMVDQAEAFQLPMEDIGLEGVDPDSYLATTTSQ